MKPITAKNFEGLDLWEFESKSVRDSIYAALIDREALIKKPHVTEEFIKKEAERLIIRFSCECELSYLQQSAIRCVLTEKGDLWDLLNRAGIEIGASKEVTEELIDKKATELHDKLWPREKCGGHCNRQKEIKDFICKIVEEIQK